MKCFATFSIAARASLRTAPVSPVDTAGMVPAVRRSASSAMAVAFVLSSVMTSSISRRAWRSCVSRSSFKRRRNVSSRWRSASSR